MKYWVFLLILLLLASNGFWIYRLVDDAVTKMYTDASYDMANQMYRQSIVLSNLNLIGLDVDQAKEKIGKDIHGLDSFEKDGCLYVGQICLQISSNRTIEVIRGSNP